MAHLVPKDILVVMDATAFPEAWDDLEPPAAPPPSPFPPIPSHHNARAKPIPVPKVPQDPKDPLVLPATMVNPVTTALTATMENKDPPARSAHKDPTDPRAPKALTEPSVISSDHLDPLAVPELKEKVADPAQTVDPERMATKEAEVNPARMVNEATMADPDPTETPETAAPRAPLALATIAQLPVWLLAIKLPSRNNH